MQWYEIITLIGVPSMLAFLFTFLFNRIFNRIGNKKNDDALIKKGLQALLRDRLLEKGTTYTKRGYVSLADKDNFNNLYKNYHALGKNGVMDNLYSEVLNLPNEKPKKSKGE